MDFQMNYFIYDERLPQMKVVGAVKGARPAMWSP